MGSSLQAALQEHANGLVFLLVFSPMTFPWNGEESFRECWLINMYFFDNLVLLGPGPCLYDCDHGCCGQVRKARYLSRYDFLNSGNSASSPLLNLIRRDSLLWTGPMSTFY